MRSIFLSALGCMLVACIGDGYDGDPLVVDEAPTASNAPSASASSSQLTPAPQPSPSPSPAPDAGTNDAAAVIADAGPDVAPAPSPTPLSCAAESMSSSAPVTSCTAAPAAYAGGTISLGTYYLSQWSDGTSTCTSTSKRQGTMTIEQVDGTLYMRWVRSVDGRTAAGYLRLAPDGATTVTRTEVCNKLAMLQGTTTAVYQATSSQIAFGTDSGHETWTRMPKTTSTSPLSGDPVTK